MSTILKVSDKKEYDNQKEIFRALNVVRVLPRISEIALANRNLKYSVCILHFYDNGSSNWKNEHDDSYTWIEEKCDKSDRFDRTIQEFLGCNFCYRLIFGDEKGEKYTFKGLFKLNIDKLRRERCLVWDRIGIEVDVDKLKEMASNVVDVEPAIIKGC
jgi:hypothetical protein